MQTHKHKTPLLSEVFLRLFKAQKLPLKLRIPFNGFSSKYKKKNRRPSPELQEIDHFFKVN